MESSSQSAHFAHTCVNKTVFLTTRTPSISVAFKIAAMSPNGDAFLLKPDGPEGPTRFPQARSVPTNSRTIYVSGIASILPDGTVAGAADGQVPDARVQTSTILQTIDTIIKGASNGKGGIANLIDSVVYLTEMERDYAGMNEEWNKVRESECSSCEGNDRGQKSTRSSICGGSKRRCCRGRVKASRGVDRDGLHG
jgi:2-aminomuconate deaminase